MMDSNIILNSDSYKVAHWNLFPPDMTHAYYYFEARTPGHQMHFCLIKYMLKKYLAGVPQKVFIRQLWDYIVEKHGGRLPLKIKAMKEGTVAASSNVMFTVENTDPNCYWLPGYVESILVRMWYPITVATNSSKTKKVIEEYLNRTSDNTDASYKLHDFGPRGVSSEETAAIGGAAHLLSGFKGTDNLPALKLLKDYYGMDCAGYSIPAGEHSVICSWGKEKEAQSYGNILWKYPTGPVAFPIDSYDMTVALEEHIGESPLREKIINRDGVFVARPDSGNPIDMPLFVLDTLQAKFGSKINSKGYKNLPKYLSAIQGDGINHNTVPLILENLTKHGWATENLAFGSGGGLLQKVSRDDYGFAYKMSAAKIRGKWVDVFKEPKTDDSKKSKRGRLKSVEFSAGYFTTGEAEDDDMPDCLVDSFLNGDVLI